ncbi:MAG: alkaline phosphatase D family protein [Deltaproteobacteria bacterium]
MTLTRRSFLGQVAPAGVASFLPGAALSGCGRVRDETRVNGASGEVTAALEPWPATNGNSPFRHGVASGDPLSDAVVLWTRVTPVEPVPGSVTRAAPLPVQVEWRLALDPELEQVVAEGSSVTDAGIDHTVHVDATGLDSDTTYYFQFRAFGLTSLRGRTKTLPAGSVARMRLGVVSCANYPGGFFNVYGLLAAADVDLVLHLGDYIYEYPDLQFGDGAPIGRAPDPAREIVSLDDYRRRHAQYKTDLDLQEVHRQHPFIAMWDDHEVANNSYQTGAQNHQADEGDFQARKQSALQAYLEWMPIRASRARETLYRSFVCGDLLDLVLLDTRHAGRDAQVNRCDAERLEAPARQLLGAAQEAWLGEQLGLSQARGARWRLIAQQVIFAPRVRLGGCVQNSDSWDGYGASRTRVLDALERDGIDNVVVLTGDAHSSWGIDVARDPFDRDGYDPETGRGSQLVELVTPAVSSPAAGTPEQSIVATHPHVKFTDQFRQGYLLLDVTAERTLAEWHLVPTVRVRSAEVEVSAVLQTLSGQPHLIAAAGPSVARSALPAPAR